MVGVYIKFVTFLLLWRDKATSLMMENKVQRVQKVGTDIMKWLGKAAELAPKIEQGVQETENRGFTVDTADDFRDAAKMVMNARAEFQRRWPWVDDEKLRQSIEDEKRGVGHIPAKDVFNELRRRVR